MKARHRSLILLLALFGALALWLSRLSDQAPPGNPSTTPSPVQRQESTQPANGNKDNAPKRSIRLSGQQSFDEIQAQIARSRKALGRCFMLNQEFSAQRVKVEFTWEGNGTFRNVKITPSPGESTTECVSQVAKNWNAPPHPGLQPFQFGVEIAL